MYKHKEVLKDNVFVFDTDEVYCVWQNTPCKDNVVEISLDFFIPDGNNYYRMSENFRERAYTVEELSRMLEAAGFAVQGIYGDMTFADPTDTEQRLVFVAKKMN